MLVEPNIRPAAPDESAELRKRLLVGGLLAIGVLVLSLVPAVQFRYWQWIALALGAPVVLWGAWPAHRAACRAARCAAVTGDTLTSLGSLAALGWSGYILLFEAAGEPGLIHPPSPTVGRDGLYLDAAAGTVLFLLVTRWLQAWARRRAGAGGPELGASGVTVLRDGAEMPASIVELGSGSRFVVRPGETIAADGVVVEGSSAVDTSLLTGAGTPVEVRAGEVVAGGSVNVGGRLVVRATAVGPDTRLARMTRQVATAQHGRTAAQRLADRSSGPLGSFVLGSAVATLGYWLGAGAGPAYAVGAAVAVLAVAGPSALGLAAPLALITAIGRGARLGYLIKAPEVLDSLCRVDTIVLDKTGTVTTGVMALQGVQPSEGVAADLALRLAGAVEQASEHPIGRAIAAAARAAADGELPGVAEFDSMAGLGVRGLIAEVDDERVIAHAVLVGRPALLAEHGIELPADLITARAATEEAGHTSVVVAWDGVARAVLAVSDTVEPTSIEAVRRLRASGLRPMLLTGDTGGAARALAEQIGIDPDGVLAEVQPEDKADVVRRLQGEGHGVAVVGDGVADAEALAVADFGVAVGRGDGDLRVASGELLGIVAGIRLIRRTRTVIRWNLGWLAVYHAVAVPLAAAGLVQPLLGAAGAAISSAVVVANCLRLRRIAGSATTGPKPNVT